MMIELVEGFYVCPDEVTVVKADGKKRCVLFVTGQSGLDGFALDYPAEEVVEAINDAFVEDEGKEEDEPE
jgi:hypothetical protein